METLEQYIQEVAAKNKIILSPQDPVCALHTVLAKFEGDMKSTFAELAQNFASQLELEYKKSSDLASEQAQSLLQSALGVAREDASVTYRQSAEGLIAAFSAVMGDRLLKLEKAKTGIYYIALANALCAVCLLATAVFLLLK